MFVSCNPRPKVQVLPAPKLEEPVLGSLPHDSIHALRGLHDVGRDDLASLERERREHPEDRLPATHELRLGGANGREQPALGRAGEQEGPSRFEALDQRLEELPLRIGVQPRAVLHGVGEAEEQVRHGDGWSELARKNPDVQSEGARDLREQGVAVVAVEAHHDSRAGEGGTAC
jgi:hypothetical protein